MEYQSLLHKKLHAGNFVFTAETTPPDASDSLRNAPDGQPSPQTFAPRHYT